jgi:FkbM family methyltransferase
MHLMAASPIQFDRTTGVLSGANAWERGASLALLAGSKVSSLYYHRGYNMSANLLKRLLPERDINIALDRDAVFSFPFGDGYWSKLLNRSFKYEDELEIVLFDSRSVDYTLIDCGANYGYWSVLVSSERFGSRLSLAMEPSSQNHARLAHNARINGNRFEAIKAAVGVARGTAKLSGHKHEAFSIAGDADAMGEQVEVISLDSLVEDAKVSATGKFIIKLDVEGVEIDAMEGGKQLRQTDSVFVCEEHGNDPHHTVSRYILERTPMKAIIHNPVSDRFEFLTDLSTLDRMKTTSNIGYNIFATASSFWTERILAIDTAAVRRIMRRR